MMASLTLLSGCGLFAPATEEGLRVRSTRFLVKRLEAQRLDYTWYEAKAKMQYETAERAGSARAYIRMRRDSAIWVSVVPLLGIEVVRAYITPDSLTVLNRLEKKWASYSFAQAESRFSMPNWRFRDLQDLLIGKAPDRLAQLAYDEATIEGRRYVLEHQGDSSQFRLGLWPEHWSPAFLQYRPGPDEESFEIRYGQHEALDKGYFPQLIKLDIFTPQKLEASFNLSRIAFDEAQSMPFAIPAGYKKTR
jgi:hypothetical protein